MSFNTWRSFSPVGPPGPRSPPSLPSTVRRPCPKRTHLPPCADTYLRPSQSPLGVHPVGFHHVSPIPQDDGTQMRTAPKCLRLLSATPAPDSASLQHYAHYNPNPKGYPVQFMRCVRCKQTPIAELCFSQDILKIASSKTSNFKTRYSATSNPLTNSSSFRLQTEHVKPLISIDLPPLRRSRPGLLVRSSNLSSSNYKISYSLILFNFANFELAYPYFSTLLSRFKTTCASAADVDDILSVRHRVTFQASYRQIDLFVRRRELAVLMASYYVYPL
ncbi:hypothetical protein C8F04DRAFT_1131683 [Mycena alexandri]|uniref:Uncharacterized protein n=1 Tax=Mycena alexandri TaxID=1745969 RepID=A0AAD6WUV7_9AGAR|nr:hypothetical protein C8F04DRAFT_1131683 [Mycena alexandri]